MSVLACSLLPSRDVRSYHLHDRVPVEYPQYALSDRRRAACVMRSYARTTIKDRRHLGRGDATIRSGEVSLDIRDWECYADRLV
jgi:hypothetical protein